MEEYFEVRFANSEEEFIYQSGTNRGHVQVPTKITNCYLLNASEKYLYDLLKGFMFGEKRSCFPSIELLLGLSGWSRSTFKKHLDSLLEANLVDYIVREGTTNLYILKELHKSTLIVHSEMLHQVKDELFERAQGRFNVLRVRYKESELFEKISKSVNPLEYYEEMKGWFTAGGQVAAQETEEVPEVSPMEETQKGPSIEESRSRKDLLIKMAASAKKVSAVTSGGELQKVADPDKQPKKKKVKPGDYKELELESWNIHHFFRYYEDTYLEKVHFPMSVHQGDLAQLRALLDRYKPENLKERINLFFENKQFGQITKNIYSFSSAFTQSKIDKLLNFGHSDSYKSNEHGPLEADEQQQLEQWMKDMGIEE